MALLLISMTIIFYLLSIHIWTKYSRMDQVKFVEERQPLKNLKGGGRSAQEEHIPLYFTKAVLLNQFLITLTHLEGEKLFLAAHIF